MTLRSSRDLERSAIVANSAMNRSRRLVGANSYSKDLGVDLAGLLEEGVRRRGALAWLDLCCGEGRALEQALEQLEADPRTRGRVEIVGVDLVASFDGPRETSPRLAIVEANVERWDPGRTFDLVTCVHGLHYVGDKLGLIQRALSWLRPEGQLMANLDLANLVLEDGRPAARVVTAAFRASGLQWSRRDRVLRARAPCSLVTGLEYVGADDTAGPNFTGQPAVNSVYRRTHHLG